MRIPPLGSPWSGLKRLFEHAWGVPVRWSGGACAVRGVPGVVRCRWVPGEAIPGVLPSGLYWYCQGPTIDHYERCLRPPVTPGPCWAFRTTGSSHSTYPASGPIQARFHHIYPKVSQISRVSPKKCHEACHTPGFKKRPRSHDLEFPRFPILLAFSAKE